MPIRLRNRWRNCLVVALILGLTLGASLAAFAGARRTQSSYDRFLRAANASTMSVSTPRGFEAADIAAVAALDGVAQSRTWVGFTAPVLVDGRPDFSQVYEATGSLDGEFFDQDRFAPLQGRAADPTRSDEVVFNEVAAQQFGYHVGQQLDFGVYTVAQSNAPTFFADPPPPASTVRATVVGIGLFPDEPLQDESDRSGRMLFTPAFTARHMSEVTYGLQGLVLSRGDAGVEDLKNELRTVRAPGTTRSTSPPSIAIMPAAPCARCPSCWSCSERSPVSSDSCSGLKPSSAYNGAT